MSKEQSTPNKVRLFVYGSLKRGFPLAGWLARSDHIEDGEVFEHTLLSLGPYPAMFYTGMPEHGVMGEVYDVPEDDFARLQQMEEAVGYQAVDVYVGETGGAAKAFILGTIPQGTVEWQQTTPKRGVVVEV